MSRTVSVSALPIVVSLSFAGADVVAATADWIKQFPWRNGLAVDICEQIRQERRAGKVRCGIIEGGFNAAEVAKAFSLDPEAIERRVTAEQASRLAEYILCRDIAYGSRIMSNARAQELWRQFVSPFNGANLQFFTNVGSFVWMDTGAHQDMNDTTFSNATSSTFDWGVLVVDAARSGCLWVEDED